MAALYLTTTQVAERWACDRTTVTARARSGELVGMRLGSDWRFSLAAVEAYELAHTKGTPSTTPASKQEDVRPPAVVDGFTLPKDYRPVFPELWNR